MYPKTLAVVTGTRAEYGLLRPVIRRVQQTEGLQLQLLVTGAHLSPVYGSTVEEILRDGFPIADRIDILKYADTPLGIARTIACAIELFAAWFGENKPDGCLVLGDRYEIFAAATAASVMGVPVIHISGGDVTLGAADEFYRHSITKMAKLHFPSCAEYAARVIRMGEDPATVHNVGGLGDENIRNLPLVPLPELSRDLGFDLVTRPYLLVTFHPETAGEGSPAGQMDALLGALEKRPDYGLLFTKANADAGGRLINDRIDDFCSRHPDRTLAFTSLGVVRYLSAMKGAAAVVGNSSSGVVETPTFGVPAINIGDRQKGRILCANVIGCPARQDAIEAALNRALSPSFARQSRQVHSPYDGGNTSEKIVQITAAFLNSPLAGAPKGFYDGPHGESCGKAE